MGDETSKDRVFIRSVGSALLRLVALVLFLVVHYYLNKALVFFCPANLTGTVIFVESVIFVFFALIYVYLAWDMVTVFVPWLRRAEGAKVVEQEVDNK